MERLGVYSGYGRALCSLNTGNHSISINKTGKKLYTLINGKTAMASRSEKEFSAKALPVVGLIAQKINPRVAPWKGSKTPYVQNILNYLQKNKFPAETFVLEAKPDEAQENAPAEVPTTMSRPFLAYIEKAKEVIERIHKNAYGMCHFQPSSEVWGSKEIVSYLKGVRKDFEELSKASEECTGHIEKMPDYLSLLQKSSKMRLAAQMISLSDKIIEGFDLIKSYVSELTQTLSPLYELDTLCQKSAGFPATFFFPSSAYLDFRYDYNELVNNMIMASIVEKKAIQPLLIFKVKISGDSNV